MLLIRNKDQQQNHPLLILQPASAGKGADTSELQSRHCMTPEQWTSLLCSSVTPAN